MPVLKRPKRGQRRFPAEEDGFVRVARSAIGRMQQVIVTVGTSILGGNLTGDARGEYAVDIQTTRLAGGSGASQVASGDNAVQIGALNTTSADYGVRIGYGGLVSGTNGVGIGQNANVTGANGVAIGLNSNAEGADSVALAGADIRTDGALGLGATARLLNAEYVFNTGVGPVVKRAAGLALEANWPKHLGGALAVYTSGLLNLKDATFYTLALPDGTHFLPLAMGLWVTDWNNVTVQPFVKFGVTFTDDKYVAARQTTELTALGKREHYLPESLADWETDPNFTVTVAATATTLTARVYWVGLLLEDE